MDEERVQSVNDVIQGIARRSAYKFKTKDSEELAQEMWVEVLNTEKNLGMPLTLDYVAKICYNTVVDLQRYDMLRNSYSLEEMEESTSLTSCEDSIDSKIMIHNLFAKYPAETAEGIYLRFYATKIGICDYYEPTSVYKNGYTDGALAQLLGFKGTADRGWKRFRDNFQSQLRKYFFEDFKKLD